MPLMVPGSTRQSPFFRTKVIFFVVPFLLAGLLLPSCNLIGTALGLGLAKLQFGCVPEGTWIDTAAGPVKIETLKSGDFIFGFNGKPVQITQIHQYREDPATSRYLTIHFSHGEAVSASPRHRIDGVPAARLRVGDACGSQTVTRIEPLHGVSRSFDLLTEDPGYRIAGIPVNSMIEEMLGHRNSAPVDSASR
ncbi:MAG: Hint domain [Verrucomicrobiota bacterium]|jgi:hypothetical protein